MKTPPTVVFPLRWIYLEAHEEINLVMHNDLSFHRLFVRLIAKAYLYGLPGSSLDRVGDRVSSRPADPCARCLLAA